MSRILITGGAGFIGRRLTDKLLEQGHSVLIIDNLHPQIHGNIPRVKPLTDNVAFVRASINDRGQVAAALEKYSPEIIYHLASETGTGQSFFEIDRYCKVNISGTAILLEEIRIHAKELRRFVMASSRAIYGEGAYKSQDGSVINPKPRSIIDMEDRKFEITDPAGYLLKPIPTREDLCPRPSSIYASTKLMQEYLIGQAAEGLNFDPVVLRLQNVFGPGQSLNNPYTGVLSIFCSKLLRGDSLAIFEDGKITRDFIFVDDVVNAMLIASDLKLDAPASPINIGSGRSTTIYYAAEYLSQYFNKNPIKSVKITGEYRAGDIRHAVADISYAQVQLGWSPKISLEEGLKMLADWAYKEFT